MKATELGWGLRIDAIEAPSLWGARCILEERVDHRGRYHRSLDVLWDRQDIRADEGTAYAPLKDALNDGALQKFRAWVEKDGYFDPGVDEVATREFDGVVFWASTRASFGYLYVTAHLAEPVARAEVG